MEEQKKNGMRWMPGSGIGIGIALGAGIGLSLDNLALGMGVGLAIGVALDGSMYAYDDGKRKSGASKE